jgi:hypothetical protein
MTVYRLILWAAKTIGTGDPERVSEFLSTIRYADEPKEAYDAIRVFRRRRQDFRFQKARSVIKSAYDTGDPDAPADAGVYVET